MANKIKTVKVDKVQSAEELNALEVIDALKKELAQIETITGRAFKISGPITTGLGASIEIEKSTKVDELLKLSASVRVQETLYNEEATSYGLKEYPSFKFDGKSPEAIRHDIALQLAILGQKQRKDEITALMKEAEQFISEGEKRKAFMEKVKKRSSQLQIS